MRCYVSVACALSVLAAVSLTAPTTLDQQQIALNVQSPSVDKTEKVRRRRDAEDDQEVAASGGNVPLPIDDLSNIKDDADIDKRVLPFGRRLSGRQSGSGNILFTIIREVAESGMAAGARVGVVVIDVAEMIPGSTLCTRQ